MANDNFNKPLLLINNKPNADNMVSNGYGFYMFPTLTMQYANTVLTDCERRLYFAICGQAGKDKLGNPYCWAIKHYCDIANIKVNHYAKYLQSLQKKGFIIHNDFESIEVLYPISQEQYIAPNGEICFWQDSLNRNNAQENFSIEEVQNSPNGKSGIDNIQATALPKKEEQAQNGNNAYNFSNKNSPKCANNREIKINKEKERESLSKENEYNEKIERILEQIGSRFNIKEKVFQQAEDLRNKGLSNEFIYYALDNKSVADFSMGIGLLFTSSYQKEIKAKIENKKREEQKELEQLQRNFEKIEELKNKQEQVRIVKAQKRIIPQYTFHSKEDFEWETEEEKEEKEQEKINWGKLI